MRLTQMTITWVNEGIALETSRAVAEAMTESPEISRVRIQVINYPDVLADAEGGIDAVQCVGCKEWWEPSQFGPGKRYEELQDGGFSLFCKSCGGPGPEDPPEEKDPDAVSLGRRGGLKGGKARAAKLTPEQRSASAREAAEARWSKPRA